MRLLQLLVLFRDRQRVSRVLAGATSGDCEAYPIVHDAAARGRVGALICRGGALLGGRELLLVLLVLVLVLVLGEGVLLLVLVVVVVGASPILH
jgi:hypothetical protein